MNEKFSLDEMKIWAQNYTKARAPDFLIGNSGNIYLQRWYVIPRSSGVNIYLHKFLRSDDYRAMHDHPGDNQSWILDGSYLEHTVSGIREFKAGDTVKRIADHPHRVELINNQPVLSLFIIGPIVREWGFHCPQGWVKWQDFVQQIPGGNSIGRGCE